MRVSSPIGELPFEPTRLRYHRGVVEMDGRMGEWPARVVVGPEDIPSLLRLVRTPALVALATGAVLTGLATLTAAHRTRHTSEGNRAP